MLEFGFYIKKFISFFIDPLGFTLSLLIVGVVLLYLKRYKSSKLFLSSSLLSLFLFSYPLFSNFLVKTLEDTYTGYNLDTNVTYIHVLGNGHNTDKNQPISSHISDAGTKRVLEGVILYKQHKGSKIIFTGYNSVGTDIPSAVMGARLALALGVDKDDIILGKKALDTEDEAKFCKSVVKSKEPFILVTSATHMPRAMRLFRSYGLNPIPAPTDFHRKEYSFLSAPSAKALENSSLAIHEFFGILWSKLR